MPSRATLLAFISFVILGGVNFVAVRLSNRELPPLFGAGFRFTLAALLLAVFLVVGRQSLPKGRGLVGVLLFGVLTFGFANALAYYALTAMPAGIASVIAASMPLFVVFLAHRHGLERVRLRAIIGAVVSVAGIVILSDPFAGGRVALMPLLAMIGSSVAAAEGVVVAKLFPPVNPSVATAVAMGLGGSLLLVASATLGESWQLPTLAATRLALGYLVLGGGAMFVLLFFIVRRWSAGAASYSAPLIPVAAFIAAAITLGEPITPTMVAGGLVVLAGVYIGALAPSRPTVTSELR